MKDQDELAAILVQLEWLRLPGMARALEELIIAERITEKAEVFLWEKSYRDPRTK